MSIRRLILTGLASLGALSTVLVLGAVPAAAEECSNASFRTGPSAHLPDCRAYELVTPPFKNGGNIEELDALDPEGSSLLVAITAATAGAEGDPNISFAGAPVFYSIARTANGWTTAPADPPSSEYIAAKKFNDGAGAGLGGVKTVWLERKAGQPADSVGLFMRQPDRSLVEVGPALPPSTPAGEPSDLRDTAELYGRGVSADGSRVFFSLESDYWPGDETREGQESLYEYLGTGHRSPLLVGVNSRGEQIGQCGEVIGGASGHESYGNSAFTDNAVSADGNTVFFSVFPDLCGGSAPSVTELFARIDNGLPGAHTVSISEPSEEDCAACYENGQIISANRLAGATFVGASEDGSKVFFETAQPLLGSDTSTNLYEYNFDAPAGQRLVHVSAGDTTVSEPAAEVLLGNGADGWVQISQDGSHAYFLANGVLTKTPNRLGESAEAGAPNLYVFERDAEHPSGHIAFITRLSPLDLGQSGDVGLQSNVTPDGRFLVFTSSRDLTPDDTSAVRQVFEYDAQTGSLVRVSVGEDGFNHNGNTPANFATIRQPCYACGEYEASGYWSNLSVSADGAYVFFQSPAALAPQAIEGFQSLGQQRVEGFENIYEYHDGQVSLISDGQDVATDASGASVVRLLGTDASGGDVFFTTADQLDGQDGDTAVDIYDARIDGGFPAPAAPASCEGEGCQGPLSGAPTLLSSGSEFQAGGNPPLTGEPVTSSSQVKNKGGKKAKSGKKKKKAKEKRKTAKVRGVGRHRGKEARRSSDRGGRS